MGGKTASDKTQRFLLKIEAQVLQVLWQWWLQANHLSTRGHCLAALGSLSSFLHRPFHALHARDSDRYGLLVVHCGERGWGPFLEAC